VHRPARRAAVRERVIHAAADNIIQGLLSRDRAQMLAAILPATQAEQDDRNRARAEELSRQLAQNETAQNGLIAQLERLGSDTSPADAMRQRITDQFTERYNQGKELQAQRQHQGQALRRIRHPGPVPSPQETSHHLGNHHQRHTRHRRRPHRRPPHR
jgi:hypothetical protein